MTAARERAEEVGRMPHVRRWIARLRRLAQDMPPEVEVLVMSGTPCVMALDDQRRGYEKGAPGDQGADRDALIDTIHGGRWDGGDW